jgi:hypothetical protein
VVAVVGLASTICAVGKLTVPVEGFGKDWLAVEGVRRLQRPVVPPVDETDQLPQWLCDQIERALADPGSWIRAAAGP